MSNEEPLPSNPNPSSESATPSDDVTRRRSLWLGIILVVLTGFAGLAAHVSSAGTVGGGVHTTPPPLPIAAAGGGPVQFTAQVDRDSVLVDGDGRVLIELVLRGDPATGLEPVRTPTDLVVVLDRSGSMAGNAMQHAQASTRELIERLGRDDRFALVSYANGARIDIPLSPARGNATDIWSRQVNSIGAGGGTNMSSGLDLAHQMIHNAANSGRSTRVILISDGHANQGDATPNGLRSRAGRAIPSEYVLSTVGVGDGFDESLMANLADAGTGNFYYVHNLEHLAAIFSDELLSARETVAQALAIEIAPQSGIRVVDAAGYPLERNGDHVVVHPGALFAGQERKLWLTLDVDPSRRTEVNESIDLAGLAVSYRGRDDAPHRHALEHVPEVKVVKGKADFYAGRDSGVYREQLMSEGIGTLRKNVADAVRDGDQKRARGLIQEFESSNKAELRAMGYADAENDQAIVAAKDMAEEVSAAMAPSAPSSAANVLGKKLSASSVDARRQGAKRSASSQ